MTPDQYTITEKFIPVSDGFSLYTQEWGNKHAKTTIISLHGGPGSSSKDKNKILFDPKQHHVIFFDQRGGGQSSPVGDLTNITTDKMIDDITSVADAYKVDNFILTGGSWGSCLALLYGIQHPTRVTSMILNGIFTATQNEIEWIDNGQFKTFFPDVWDQYLAMTPKLHHHNPSAYHMQNAFNKDRDEAKKSAYAYSCMEGGAVALNDRFTPEDFSTFDPTGTLVEMHYLKNKCFIPEGYIRQNAHKLTMPIWFIQGRYDNVCPPVTAYELNKALPNSKLIWTIAGHAPEHETITVIKTLLSQYN